MYAISRPSGDHAKPCSVENSSEYTQSTSPLSIVDGAPPVVKRVVRSPGESDAMYKSALCVYASALLCGDQRASLTSFAMVRSSPVDISRTYSVPLIVYEMFLPSGDHAALAGVVAFTPNEAGSTTTRD